MFTKAQKDLLRSVGRTKNDPDFGKPNPALDDVILQLRKDNPRAFLIEPELDRRVFMDEPVDNIPYGGYMYGVNER
jgi:hypothetical protein